MRLVSAISTIGVAALLAGCSQSGPRSASGPGVAPPCQLAGTMARSCVKRGNKNVCNVYVGEIGGVPHVYPSVLSVSKQERDTVIIWHLEVIGARFDKGSDGPIWKGDGSEFEDGGPTDDADGDHQNKPAAKRYRIKFKNSPNAGSYEYTIKYHDNQGNVKMCDPLIASQAG